MFGGDAGECRHLVKERRVRIDIGRLLPLGVETGLEQRHLVTRLGETGRNRATTGASAYNDVVNYLKSAATCFRISEKWPHSCCKTRRKQSMIEGPSTYQCTCFGGEQSIPVSLAHLRFPCLRLPPR